MIQGNPHIKAENKPNSIDEMCHMSWEDPIKKESKVLSPEEIEKIRLELMDKMNANN